MGYRNCHVRCGACHHRFRLPKRVRVSDDAIAAWLSEGMDEEDEVSLAEEMAGDHGDAAAGADSRQDSVSGQTAVLPAVAEHKQIRMIRLDRRGALFEFPAYRLKETSFRCAMPRRCLHCGTRHHLQAHVIVYTAHLLDSISLEAERSAGTMMLSDAEARDLDPHEVLERLPRVPNAPHPADMPMPYWLCDMCKSADAVSGQVQVNSETGKGFGRLLIRNLRRAEEFLCAAGGEDSADHAKLREWTESTAENPWDTLPTLIQHRISQWWRPRKGEQFVAYIPDRDHARTEDGMAGVVITTRRLVYHTRLRHHESSVEQPVELALAMGGGKGNVNVKTAGWQVKHFTVDRDGANRFRRGLTLARFHATWT